jgi:type II secretory pathway component GspD/PulD (secretin)
VNISNAHSYVEINRGIPGIDKIPFIGNLFSSKEIENQQGLLVWLIEARAIEPGSEIGTRR